MAEVFSQFVSGFSLSVIVQGGVYKTELYKVRVWAVVQWLENECVCAVVTRHPLCVCVFNSYKGMGKIILVPRRSHHPGKGALL